MTGLLTVLNPGAFTTLQDLGRQGVQAQGVPVSGALDIDALRSANLLVGNAAGEAALEIRYFGPTLRVEADSIRVALVGSGGQIDIRAPESTSVPANRSVTLPRGAVFSVPSLRGTATAYLAIAGGFAVEPHFGSRATYTIARIGGFDGEPLRDGQTLPLHAASAPEGPDLQLPEAEHADTTAPIRVVLGPQDDYFSAEGLKTFLESDYEITAQSNRMAMRLDGPAIAHQKGFNIPSDGIVTGAIQVPGEGKPIILLADRQTTGGYPKIACVISTDLPRLARAKPGAALRFAAVSVEAAEQARRDQEAALEVLWSQIHPVRPAEHGLLDRLHAENLIDGVHSAFD